MFGGEHHIFRARVMEYFGPGAGIPLLNLLVENRSKVVVIVVSAIMLAMVSLGRRSVESHAVQVPLGIGVVSDVVLGTKVVLRVNQRSPSRYRIKAPMDEDAELRVREPLRKGMLLERGNCWLIVSRRLRMQAQSTEK